MTGAATWKLLVCTVSQGNAEIAGLDIDGRMYEQLTELKWQNFIPGEDFHSVARKAKLTS